MSCGDDVSSPPYISSYNDGPYNSSLASSASSSSASVWSDVASLSSDDSSVHSGGVGSESDVSDAYYCTNQPSSYQPPHLNICDSSTTVTVSWPKSVVTSVAPEQRQHPRRTSVGPVARLGCPPSLVRQCDRKVNFVDSLVDSSAQIVEAIWPLSSVICRSEMGHKGVLPLRTFIQETLRRSRTSYSTLQVALYYLVLIKPHVPKCDFTMEQLEDIHSIRALQCGRRMFLAALILASKYLQDRNYSARAWSKISGLNTQEINQNEIAFLLAVNWRLHITDDVFQRWADIVLKYTPSQPPSPGAFTARSAEASLSWKSIIPQLTPELDNVDGFPSPVAAKAIAQSISSSTKPFFERTSGFESESNESTPTPKYYTPHVMEPSPSTAYPPNKPAPALGLLPTPRLTPQSIAFGTPAVSAASFMLSKSSMGFAVAQASSICAAQSTERWPGQATLSPQGFNLLRRSSLANSVSSMSSPESMVSDTSTRSSRSSSISSASSLMSAPLSSKLDVQARCRYAKQCCDRTNMRTIIAAVPEGSVDNGPTSSPDSYTGMVGKDFLELSLENRLAQSCGDVDYFSRDSSANDAARALQELHSNPRSDGHAQMGNRAGAKRSRPQSIDNSLQDNVRDMLTRQHRSGKTENWSESLVRPRLSSRSNTAVQSVSRGADGRKRVCCSAEASEDFPELAVLHRPGMWDGILN